VQFFIEGLKGKYVFVNLQTFNAYGITKKYVFIDLQTFYAYGIRGNVYYATTCRRWSSGTRRKKIYKHLMPTA